VDVVPPNDEEMEDATNVAPPATTDATTTADAPPAAEEEGGSSSPTSVIPQSHLEQLEDKWKELSSERKKTLRAKKKRDKLIAKQGGNSDDTTADSYATVEALKSWERTQTKNLHKASYKAGLLGLSGTKPTTTNPDDTTPTTPTASPLLVTSARDKQLVFYDTAEHVIVHKEAIKTSVDSNCIDSYVDGTTGEKVVVCVGDDTILRVFCSSATKAGEGEEGNEWDDMRSCTASPPPVAPYSSTPSPPPPTTTTTQNRPYK